MTDCSTDIIYAIGGKVAEMMRAQGGFYSNPPPGLKDPMEWTHGHRFFDFFAHNQEARKDFNDYMSARREGYQLQWFDIFPVHERAVQKPVDDANGVLVCDVGGGHGHELVKFQQKYPDTKGRLVLEDLESTFDGLSLPAGIEAVPHDFFQPQPVTGARFYYMRQIMHDWSDEDCRTILGHLVGAMDADSTLLIDDYVMPPTDAEFRAVHMDVCMMIYLRSEERTQRRWTTLLESAGLEVVKVWTPETGFESVIETKLKQ